MDNKIILEWDEAKRRQNLAERGIDFIDAIDVFSDPNMCLYLDERMNYGEERFNAYGVSKDRNLRVCFTPRNGKFRIITMFNVHKKEWSKRYVTNKSYS